MTDNDYELSDHDMWIELVKLDPDSWDEGTLRAHLEIEGVTGDEQDKLVKLCLDPSECRGCLDDNS